MKYKETYINTDGDRIISSNGKSRAEIYSLEIAKREEIYSVTVYINKEAITINMNDGSSYEYIKE